MIARMSATIPCPQCGTANPFPTISIIDVEDQSDGRVAIIERTLHRQACGNCGTLYRSPPRFAYFDRRHDLWIAAFAWDERHNWRAVEQQAQTLFDVYRNATTSLSAQMRSAPLNRRVTFGWEALREKIVAAERRLDDVSLELLKRELRQPPSGAETDFRLLDADESQLVFGRVVPAGEEIVEQITVPRARFDAVSADPAWSNLRDELLQSTYVDLRRLSATP